MLYGAISTVVILFLVIIAARRSTIQPKKGFVQFIEIGTEFIIGLLESNFGDRTKAIKYAPYFVSLFFYIMLTNWLGLLPFVGEGFVSGETPLFRPFTADLNGTLAAATITIIMVQIFAIKESGLAKHARHYFAGSLKNPMTYLMGGFELFGELTRIISLALRLFLNVAIGEIIIAVFSYLGQAGAPITALPFYILELLVGALQAYIFVMLSVVYLAIAIKHDHDESHSEEYESVHTISEAKA
jgi:F-type H+-transporting ATPase subunit a